MSNMMDPAYKHGHHLTQDSNAPIHRKRCRNHLHAQHLVTAALATRAAAKINSSIVATRRRQSSTARACTVVWRLACCCFLVGLLWLQDLGYLGKSRVLLLKEALQLLDAQKSCLKLCLCISIRLHDVRHLRSQTDCEGCSEHCHEDGDNRASHCTGVVLVGELRRNR